MKQTNFIDKDYLIEYTINEIYFNSVTDNKYGNLWKKTNLVSILIGF